jgi:hypothetical protein
MAKIEVNEEKFPLITFDSDNWKDDNDYLNVAAEIIKFIKEHDYENILIQNEEYSIGDTESSPIIMINKGASDDFIKDVISDLIPDYEE